MSDKTNYYKELGISEKATAEEIDAAYKRLARAYHPDRARGQDKDAFTKRFQAVQNAYDTLKDPAKKQQYDLSRSGGFGGFNFSDMGFSGGGFSNFGEFKRGNQSSGFSFEDIFSGMAGSSSKAQEQITFKVTLTLEETMRGVSKTLKYETKDICSNCICQQCGGKGRVGISIISITCNRCNGAGAVKRRDCSRCASGFITQKHNKTIQIPLGVRDGMTIQFEELGDSITILIDVQKHERFKVDGNNLHMNVQIDIHRVISGSSFKITGILNDDILVNVPKCHDIYTPIVVKGQGLYIWNTTRRGDLYVNLRATMSQQ